MCEVKVCSQCHRKLPIEDFINDEGREVRKCVRCREIQKEYRIKNKERLALKAKIYRKKYYSEHREELCRKARTYYWEHTEQSAIRHKEYSKLNRDSIKKKHKEWETRNIEKIREYERRRSINRVSELQPKYIRGILKQQGFNPEDITPDLIEIKRAIIQINRKVKQSKTE